MNTDWRNVKQNIIAVNKKLNNHIVAQIVYSILKQRNIKERLSLCKEKNFDNLCYDESLALTATFYYTPIHGLIKEEPVFKEKAVNTDEYVIAELANRRGEKNYILVY